MGLQDSQLADRLKKKSRDVIVFEYGRVYAKNLIRSKRENIGNLDAFDTKNQKYITSEDGIKGLIEFLNKFGRRLILYEFVNFIFEGDSFKIWEIDSRLLYRGYLLFHENREKFEEVAKKAKNKEEFLWLTGIS